MFLNMTKNSRILYPVIAILYFLILNAETFHVLLRDQVRCFDIRVAFHLNGLIYLKGTCLTLYVYAGLEWLNKTFFT
jgi:hypothetical protein